MFIVAKALTGRAQWMSAHPSVGTVVPSDILLPTRWAKDEPRGRCHQIKATCGRAQTERALLSWARERSETDNIVTPRHLTISQYLTIKVLFERKTKGRDQHPEVAGSVDGRLVSS